MKRLIWTTEVEKGLIRELMSDYGISEAEAETMAAEDTSTLLMDEKENLDIKTDHPILVIADLGLWNGRRPGYKILPSRKGD